MNRRKLARVAITIGTAILALVVIVVIVVRTAAFHQFVLAKVIQKLEAATGGRVEIGNFGFSWRGLRIDFYNVALLGTESASQRPLFVADHLAVGVKILSVWKRQVDLNEIILDHPVANLQIDAAGRNNLPASPARKAADANSSSSIFDLAIQHVSVRSGEIYYNDREVSLSADVHNFHAESTFSTLAQQYKVSATYDQGILTYQDLKHIPHSVNLRVTATRSGVSIDEMVATTDKSRIEINGELSNYANPLLDVSYVIQIDTAEAGAILNAATTPSGQLQLSGRINYRQAGNTPFVDGLSVDGALDSALLSLRTPSAHGELRTIRAKYQLSKGNLFVSNVQAETLGGHISASYQIDHLDAKPASRLDATAQGISVRAVTEAFAIGATPQIALAAKANLKVQAAWTDNIRRGSGNANATISTASAGQQTSGTPLEGKINVAYRGSNSTLTVSDSYFRSAATQLALSGTLSDRSNLHMEMIASDLHEIGSLVQSLQPANSNNGPVFDSKNLGGAARFRGDVSGSLHDPRITGQLCANNLDFNGSHWRTLESGVDLSSSGAALLNASLQGKQQGELAGTVRVGLTKWSFKNNSPIRLQITATKLSLADIQLLAGQHYPVTGTLGGTISVNGSENNLNGRGSLSLSQATAWNEAIKTLTVEFNGDGQSVRLKSKLQIPAGSATGTLTYAPKTKQYDADITGSGLRLERVSAIQAHNAGIAGVLSVNAKGHGTIQNPTLNATASIANLKVHDQSIPEIQAQLGIVNRHANGTVHARVEQTTVDAKGDIDLTGERVANVRVDTGSMPIGFLLASYIPSVGSDVTGQTELHATLNGPVRDPSRMQAYLEIPTLSVGYKTQQIANARPMHISYANNLFKIEDAEMKGNGADVKLTGSIPTSRAAAMNVKLNGNLDLAILKGFQQDLDTSGSVNVDLAAGGTFSNPRVRGQAKIVNAAVVSGEIPIGFENINASFDVSGNRVEISKFSGNAGGGNVAATGFLTYGDTTAFSINLDAKNVRVRYPDGVRSIAGGSLQMNGSPAASTLSGRIVIDRLSFTKDFDLASFMGQFSGDTPTEAPSALAENMKLNIAIQTASNLNAVSSKLSIEGAANLTVGGTAANPVILGRATLTAGDIFFLGKRYQVQSGTIEFVNPVRTEPTLNLYVTTTVQQYNITLNFVGPIDRLRTNYTSDPSLPPSDIINLIAFGKTAEASASAASTPRSVGAESVLAQGVSGQVSGRLENLAGISQLSIDPLAGTNPNDPGSQISIQQRVSGNLLLTFSTDVTPTQNQAIQLEYQAKRNMSVSVLRDQNGGYAIDVKVRKVF
jgi:translocation and assembly module TamB